MHSFPFTSVNVSIPLTSKLSTVSFAVTNDVMTQVAMTDVTIQKQATSFPSPVPGHISPYPTVVRVCWSAQRPKETVVSFVGTTITGSVESDSGQAHAASTPRLQNRLSFRESISCAQQTKTHQ